MRLSRDLSTLLPRMLLLALPLIASAAAPGAGQTEEEPGVILGQPAGWSMEASEAAALIDIPSGSSLRAAPEDDAGVLAILPEAKLELLESRPPWVKVRYANVLGWVDLEGSRAPPDQAVDPNPLQPRFKAGDIEPAGQIGTYSLWGSARDRGVIEYLDTIAREHARLYAERYGLAGGSPIGGDVLFIRERRAFIEYHRDQAQSEIDLLDEGFFEAPALVVINSGRGTRKELASTLVHELTHLLNWHYLGGWQRNDSTLAPWIDEGMADDMAFSAVDRKGRMRPGPLGSSNLRYGERLGSILNELEQAIENGFTPSLQRLLDMDQDTYMSGARQFHYTLSALWVRYLLSEPELAEGFRAFLAILAQGGSASSINLQTQLDRSWPELEKGFRAWRRKQRLQF